MVYIGTDLRVLFLTSQSKSSFDIPIIDMAPFSVAMQILSSTAREPLEKLSNMKNPNGPFQMMVAALSMTAWKEVVLCLPISSDIQLVEIPEQTVDVPVCRYKQ